MFLFIIGLIIGVVAICGLGVGVFGDSDYKVGGLATMVIAGIIAFACIFGSMVATVGTSDVGIETAFGKTITDLPPGFHLTAPWANVTNWDGSVQSVTYGRNTDQSKPDHCLLVRIGGQQSACLALTFTYRVRDGAADALFKAYRGSQSAMNSLLVVRTVDTDLNTLLETFSPIQAMATGNSGAAALSPYAAKVISDIQSQIGTDIIPLSLSLPYVVYDPSTTARLNAFQTQIADTLIAVEAEKTAIAQAAAIKTLQSQLGASSAAVVADQCIINVMTPLAKAGISPAGIGCWPGGAGSSTVVIPKVAG